MTGSICIDIHLTDPLLQSRRRQVKTLSNVFSPCTLILSMYIFFHQSETKQLIINKALLFVNFQTTYRNNLCEWVDECSEKDQVESIAYGIPIPAMYQNDVYKKYLSQMEGAA